MLTITERIFMCVFFQILNLTIVTGDFFECTWEFGDDSEAIIVPYELYLNDSGGVQHQFIENSKDGYEVKVECKNRLYSASLQELMYSFDPVTDFALTVLGRCKGQKEGSPGELLFI